MIGPEILYALRLRGGAMANFADPWVRGDDTALKGECA
jgi:hypothetical protein